MNSARLSGRSRTTIVMLAGFLITVAILTGACIHGFVRVHQMNEELRNAAEGRSNKISLIEGMQSLTRGGFYTFFMSYADPGAKPKADMLNAIDDFHQDFDFYRRSFLMLGVSPEEKQLLQLVADAAADARAVQEQVAESREPKPGLIPPPIRKVLGVHKALETSLERLLEFERTRVYREVAAVSAKNQAAFQTVLAMFFIAFVASIAVAWLVMQVVRRTEQLLFDEKNLAEATLNSISEGVITVYHDGTVGYINPVAEQLTGWHRKEARGKPLDQVYRLIRLEDRSALRHPAQTPAACVMRCDDATHLLVGAGGREYEVEDSASPMYDARGEVTGAVLVFRDVTATQEMSRRLEWQAGHDALTGLANRAEFQASLEEAVRSARTQAGKSTLLFLDLDRFKVVNDVCGHAAGDQLLRQVGLVIQGCLRDSDMLARLGGDEFGVLLRACEGDEAMEIARTIRNSIRDFRFVWQDRIFMVGASVGVVSVDRHGGDQAELMRAADLACHAAKEGGSDRIRMYDPTRQPLDRPVGMDMFAQIIHALDEDLFRLYRQRIAGLHGRTASRMKYEILLRMADGERTLAPGAFLPVAERYGLMKSVDRWVVERAFAFLQRSDAADAGAMYSINLSGATLNDDEFLDFLREQAGRYRVRPQDVCFEVTETVAIANLANAASFMRAARELGFQFALDDFGTGMSSFAYLKHLPLDYVKIDGAFVRDIVRNPVDREIVESIVRISRALGVETIAEYVEDQQTMALLAAIGVDYGQGYAIQRPAPVEVPVPPALNASR